MKAFRPWSEAASLAAPVILIALAAGVLSPPPAAATAKNDAAQVRCAHCQATFPLRSRHRGHCPSCGTRWDAVRPANNDWSTMTPRERIQWKAKQETLNRQHRMTARKRADAQRRDRDVRAFQQQGRVKRVQ